MSRDDEKSRDVGELFTRYVRSDGALDNIEALDAVLPDNPAVLSALGERCLQESRKAFRGGHHTEGSAR